MARSISALSLAARKSVRGLIRMIPIAAVVFGLGLIGFGLSHVFWLSMVMVLVAGMGMMQGMAASNTIIQTLTSEDKRGRVMSYYTMAFVGMAPFGSLLAGTLAHAIPPTPMWLVAGTVLAGAQWTVILNGVAVVLGAAWFCHATAGAAASGAADLRGDGDHSGGARDGGRLRREMRELKAGIEVSGIGLQRSRRWDRTWSRPSVENANSRCRELTAYCITPQK